MKKKFGLILGAILAFASTASAKETGYVSVSMDKGLEMLAQSEGAVLVDVRHEDEYSSGHIPGAVLFTMETMTKEDAEKQFPDKEQYIFVYCRSGRRSKMAASKFVSYGYTHIIEIGGIMSYKGTVEK